MVKKKTPEESKFSRRARIMARYGCVLAVIVLFALWTGWSLARTTIIDADKWNDKANRELERIDTIQPIRGDILACDGSILATNVITYDAAIDFKASRFMTKRMRQDMAALCDTMAMFYPRYSAQQWRDKFESQLDRESKKRSSFFVFLRDITYEQSEQLRKFPFFRHSTNPSYNGLVITGRSKREYPYGDMAKRSIGRVNQRPNGQIRGYSGLEYALDSLLYGTPGVCKKVPLTHKITNWVDVNAVSGRTLITTIDITLQDIVETALSDMIEKTRASWGTVVLMEAATGDIKAISNLDRDSVSGRIIESMNRAMRGIEPGSVLKSISMIVALEDGYVGNLDTPYKTNSWRFGNYEFHGHPNECSARDVLRYSSNIGIAKLVAPHFADNPNGFRERLRRLGFLDTLYTGIAGETPPHYPPLDPKAGGLVTLVQQTYGYGAIVPPIYICAMYNAIANAGRFVRPRIIRGYRTASGDSILAPTYVRDSICSRHNAHILLEMLRRVVSEKRGTAYTFLHDSEVPIAGKTGTAYVAKEKRPGQTNFKPGYKDHRWRNFSFCGIFPADKPRYTCMVVIGEPAAAVSAASSSGMIVRDIAAKMNARGLLGDTPDYRADAPVEGKVATPTIYTVEQKSMPMLKQTLGTNRVKTYKAAKSAPRGTVPDVRGMGIRQAVHTIEAAGYRAGVRGNGLVVAQSPAAGTRIRAGATVSLTMQ